LFCDANFRESLEIDISMFNQQQIKKSATQLNSTSNSTSNYRPAASQSNPVHNSYQQQQQQPQQRSYHTSTNLDTSNDFFSPQGKVQTNNQRNAHTSNTNSNFKQSNTQQFNNSPSNTTQSSANPTVCYCGASALLLTVRKEGPNQGRQFYSCANNRQCEFFSWFDAGTTSNNSPSDTHNSYRAANSPFNQRRAAVSPPSSNRQNQFGSSSNASCNRCECGLEAKLWV
jgi:DNA topoisomerase-3